MELQKILNIGERIDVSLDNSSYRTVVEDIIGNDAIVVAHPMYRNKLIYFEDEQEVTMIFYRPNGLFSFNGVLIDKYTEHNARLVSILPINEPTRIQRRRGYRLDIRIPIRMRLIDNDTGEFYEQSAETIDISEFGMLLAAEQQLPPETILDIRCKIAGEMMEMRSQVMRSIPSETRKNIYNVAVTFFEMKNWMSMTISKFILDEQIRRRANS